MKVTILDNSSIGGHSFWTTFQASHYVLRPVVFLRTHSLLSPFSDCFQLLQHDGATYIIFHSLVGAQRSRFTGKNRTSVEWRENVLKLLLWENKQEKKTKIGQFQPKVKHFYPLLHLNSYFEVRRNTVRCIKWWENKWKAKLTVSYWVFGDTQLHF